jgi:uncharacterized membrane protein YdjX (TVP38/TMEM64 family)
MKDSLSKNPKKRLIIICTVLISLFIVVEVTGIRSALSPQSIKEIFFLNPLLSILIFCAIFSMGNLLYVPGWVFLVGAVFGLGKEWGGLVTYMAAISSCTLSFFIIKSIGGDALRSIDHKFADKIFNQLDHRPVFSITSLRMIFQTMPALNYALAMANVRFRHYIIGTLVGLPIPIFLYCLFFELVFKHVLDGS